MNTHLTAPCTNDLPMPVQVGFKHRMPDGRVMELILRRVKEGNDTEIELQHDGPNHISGYGRYSDAASLLARLDDAALANAQMNWARDAMNALLAQASEVCRYQPALWGLFCPKGKLEIYTPEARRFDANYINSNFTLKWHASVLAENAHVLLHGLAQHLDYPFGPGERRFSTSRLFDLCFAAEKTIAPKGLAARIDDALQQRGLFQQGRHSETDYEHVTDLLYDKSAAIRTSYERVLQRERFAALITHWYGKPMRGVNAPILQHYQQFVELDLMLHQQHDFKGYPQKIRDELAASLHVPLAMVFSIGGSDDNASNSKRAVRA
jgi:hypothetical protein